MMIVMISMSVLFATAILMMLGSRRTSFTRMPRLAIIETVIERVREAVEVFSTYQCSDWVKNRKKCKTFIIFIVTVFISESLFVYEMMTYALRRKDIDHDIDTWTECVFSHYGNHSDKSWMKICSSHPYGLISNQEIYFNRFYFAAIGSLYALAFLLLWMGKYCRCTIHVIPIPANQ
jgi:hypothetical protein